MKYNYPIKYTAMPIIEQVGWVHGLNELERDYDVVCYIVSKCFLISNREIFRENGKIKKEYEVVFPYQKTSYREWEYETPSFNLFNYNCTNSMIVDEVFDTYKEALEYASIKNTKLLEKSLGRIPFNDNFNNKINEQKSKFYEKLDEYKLLEHKILENTYDIDSSSVKELDSLITINNDEIGVIMYNLYDYLKYNGNYIIYSISKDEYEKLITLIHGDEDIDIVSILKNANKILCRKGNGPINIIDSFINGTFYIDENEKLKCSDKKIDTAFEENDEVNYLLTTETLADVLISYQKFESIYLSDNKILKRTK